MLLRSLLFFCLLQSLCAAEEIEGLSRTSKPKTSVPMGWILVGIAASSFVSVLLVYLPTRLYYKYYKKDTTDDWPPVLH